MLNTFTGGYVYLQRRKNKNISGISEAYLELCPTSMLESFCENCLRVFWKKCSIIDVWRGSKHASEFSNCWVKRLISDIYEINHVETDKLICTTNQSSGFSMTASLKSWKPVLFGKDYELPNLRKLINFFNDSD